MNAYQSRSLPLYGYDGPQTPDRVKGARIFSYDPSATWFTETNFGISTGNLPKLQRFTGKERDAESGLDYFGARYYGSALGRWASPDWSAKPQAVPYADLADPQTLNLYTYVLNNPLGWADADGHCPAEDQCSKITVTAEVTKEPTIKTDPPQGGKQTTTVEGQVQYTLKNGDKPMAGTPVHEDVSNKVSINGTPRSATTQTADNKTNPQGVIGDQVSHSLTLAPGPANTIMTTQVNKKDTTQVLTIDSPSGGKCTCTIQRTLTNNDGSGGASSEYQIILRTPETQSMTPKPPGQ